MDMEIIQDGVTTRFFINGTEIKGVRGYEVKHFAPYGSEVNLFMSPQKLHMQLQPEKITAKENKDD